MTSAPEQLNDKVYLWGPEGRRFIPQISPPGQRDLDALRLFQSFLCNSEEERNRLSNVIGLWELVPKFSAEHLNSKSGIVPNDHKIDFEISGHPFRLTMFPGTYYTKAGDSEALRRYPGAREQAVEGALIHIACGQAEAHQVDGKTRYSVRFSTRDVARTLKMMGSTLSNGQIREALEVLSSTIMTISNVPVGNQAHYEIREPILPSFERVSSKGAEAQGYDVWSAQMHPLVTHAIRNVNYRQYPIFMTKEFAPFATYLIRQMHYMAPNISGSHPFSFRISSLRGTAPGLNHKKVGDSIKAMNKELERMQADGFVSRFECLEIFPAQRKVGRPTACDAEFTLYPGREWVKHVMAGSKRMDVTERSLGLPRSKRSERQFELPLI
ncbi:hypothetical protein [Geopseudomonas aromaticivorans]